MSCMDEETRQREMAEVLANNRRVGEIYRTNEAKARIAQTREARITLHRTEMEEMLWAIRWCAGQHDEANSLVGEIRDIAEADGLLAGESLRAWVKRKLVARN